MPTTETTTLQCDMSAECAEPVTMLDDSGFIYCTKHGRHRQAWRRCRKMRPAEVRRLERGETIAHY